MKCDLCRISRAVCNPLLENNGTGKVLIVVSQPDKRDDVEGMIYASKNGKLLKGLLLEAGIADYTITGATRCAPTTWLTGDEDKCNIHLKKVLHAKEWDAIIALGNAALRVLTKKSGMKKWRGKPIPLHKDYSKDCLIMATYGIEDYLEYPTYRNIIVRDLRNSLEKGEPDAVEFIRWKIGMKL